MHCIIHRMPLKFFFLLHHFVNIFGRKTVTCCFSYFTRLRFDRFYGGKSNVLSFSDDINSISIVSYDHKIIFGSIRNLKFMKKLSYLTIDYRPFSLNHAIVRSKAMKSSPLLGPFWRSEFWGFSLLKI